MLKMMQSTTVLMDGQMHGTTYLKACKYNFILDEAEEELVSLVSEVLSTYSTFPRDLSTFPSDLLHLSSSAVAFWLGANKLLTPGLTAIRKLTRNC